MSNINHINDFPDKLNPMLVKELRQGLRGVSFVVLFIAVQALLCFILLITAAAASHENAGHTLSRIIFFFFSVAVLVVQPLRGITALSTEIRGNTIDLLCLTRLSAWRITFGKWVSIVSQSGLILTAIIPYLILRYFFGDMQLFAEILLLLSTYVVSATFTALTVGFSAMKSVIIRVLLPISWAGFVFFYLCIIYFGGRHNFQEVVQMVSLQNGAATLTFFGIISACIYSAWLSLDLGTSMIAPLAENRSTLRRVVSLALIVVTILALSFSSIPALGVLILGLILCAPVSIISLTENPQIVTPVASRFTRKGYLGRAAGRLLYPGWAPGFLFVLLLYAIMHGLLFLYSARGTHIGQWETILLNSTFATLLFPLALTRIFARNHENRFGLYTLFLCTQYLIVLIVVACQSFSPSLNIMKYFFWVPTSYTFLDANSGISANAHVTASYFNVILYTLIIACTTFPVWKHIRQVEAQSTESE